jgi:hypothetical protein
MRQPGQANRARRQQETLIAAVACSEHFFFVYVSALLRHFNARTKFIQIPNIDETQLHQNTRQTKANRLVRPLLQG